MTTRTVMKAEIIDDMERDAAVDGARVLSAISSAIKFYQPKRFFFNERRTTTFNTVADTATYAWADIGIEFYTIDGLYVTDASNVIEVCRRDYTQFETANATSSRPLDYAPINGGLIFYPTPDDVYSMRVTGHVKLAEPADDSDANDWFTEAYELIRCRTKAYLYAHVWPDPGMAGIMQEAERQARLSLREATTIKTSTGTLQPSSF